MPMTKAESNNKSHLKNREKGHSKSSRTRDYLMAGDGKSYEKSKGDRRRATEKATRDGIKSSGKKSDSKRK